jgi:tetratricopeptide (TPR) repeat protein
MNRFAATLAVLALASSTAVAAPTKKAARAEFDKGVTAYTSGDYAGASEALGKSFELEPDVETLFAWAQTERKLDHCDKAVELYEKLLTMKIPDENKDAVRKNIEECNAIIAAQKPAPDPTPSPTPDPTPEPEQPDKAPPIVESTPTPRTDDSPSRLKDPVGGVLTGLGLVGIGVGTFFMIQGSAADKDKASAGSYNEYESLADKAESRGLYGVIGLAAGGALLVGGIIRYATVGGSKSENTVSGWVAPSGGGFALTGRF